VIESETDSARLRSEQADIGQSDPETGQQGRRKGGRAAEMRRE